MELALVEGDVDHLDAVGEVPGQPRGEGHGEPVGPHRVRRALLVEGGGAPVGEGGERRQQRAAAGVSS